MNTRKQKYEEALALLKKAEKLFNEISREHQNDWDADRFAYEVSQVISYDSGECGLEPFVKTIK